MFLVCIFDVKDECLSLTIFQSITNPLQVCKFLSDQRFPSDIVLCIILNLQALKKEKEKKRKTTTTSHVYLILSQTFHLFDEVCVGSTYFLTQEWKGIILNYSIKLIASVHFITCIDSVFKKVYKFTIPLNSEMNLSECCFTQLLFSEENWPVIFRDNLMFNQLIKEACV